MFLAPYKQLPLIAIRTKLLDGEVLHVNMMNGPCHGKGATLKHSLHLQYSYLKGTLQHYLLIQWPRSSLLNEVNCVGFLILNLFQISSPNWNFFPSQIDQILNEMYTHKHIESRDTSPPGWRTAYGILRCAGVRRGTYGIRHVAYRWRQRQGYTRLRKWGCEDTSKWQFS